MLSLSIIVLLALIFNFINGFHDTANAVAGSVSTRVLTLPITGLIGAVCYYLVNQMPIG